MKKKGYGKFFKGKMEKNSNNINEGNGRFKGRWKKIKQIKGIQENFKGRKWE